MDTGDELSIEFINAKELSGFFSVDEQGEIYFDRIRKIYVRGLTINELKTLIGTPEFSSDKLVGSGNPPVIPPPGDPTIGNPVDANPKFIKNTKII